MLRVALLLWQVAHLAAAIDAGLMQYFREAEFAVEELKKLSDSGVYETLKLVDIVEGSRHEGIYHMNTVLKLELSSPYFKSGAEKEVYSMVVMKHKDDALMSFAIDDFPDMTDDAIEKFSIEKIKRKRAVREEAFRKLELQSVHFFAENN